MVNIKDNESSGAPNPQRRALGGQFFARWDLSMISTPWNRSLGQSYAYDAAAGEGSTVYSLDSGVNTASKVGLLFSLLPSAVTLTMKDYNLMDVPPRWIFIPIIPTEDIPGYPAGVNLEKNDLLGHGTCMASKIAGKAYGVAKKAQLVIVKKASNHISYLIDGLNLIIQDIDQRNIQKAVISWSFGTSGQ